MQNVPKWPDTLYAARFLNRISDHFRTFCIKDLKPLISSNTLTVYPPQPLEYLKNPEYEGRKQLSWDKVYGVFVIYYSKLITGFFDKANEKFSKALRILP